MEGLGRGVGNFSFLRTWNVKIRGGDSDVKDGGFGVRVRVTINSILEFQDNESVHQYYNFARNFNSYLVIKLSYIELVI